MFIDWVDGSGDWHTIPEPTYQQMQIIFHRLNQIIDVCGRTTTFEVAYDTNPQVEFFTHEILKVLNLNPDDLDMVSLRKLMIDPGLLLSQKSKTKTSGEVTGSGSTREELIAGLWLGCESLSDVMLLLNTFTISQVIEISDARAKMRDPERYKKNQIKEQAKERVKEQANKFAEKHGIEIKGKKKTKDPGKTNIPDTKRKQRAADIIERNKISPKKPPT